MDHLQVVIRFSDRLYRDAWSAVEEYWRKRVGSRFRYNCGSWRVLQTYLYNWSESLTTTWRWPTYRAETCSCCIPPVILDANIVMFDLRINPLTPNDPYSGRTAPLNSKRCILYVYSTNIGIAYFKHCIYCPFFLQNTVCFIIISYLVPVLFTFYIQGVLKLKKE